MIQTIKDRISVIKTKVALEHAFWAAILLQVEIILDDSLSFYGATDGARKIWLNPSRIAEIDNKKLLGLIMHELIHIAFMHEMRKGCRIHDLWNIATDYAVNSIIVDEMHLSLPSKGLYSAKFKGLSAEEIYNILFSCSAGDTSAFPKGLGTGCERLDDHRPYPTGAEEDVKDMIAAAHDIWESSGMRGTLPGTLVSYLKRLLKPRVPWEREFQKYAGETLYKDDFSYSPPARRYLVHDLYVPACRVKKVGSLVCSIDTSASVSEKQLAAFGAEVSKLASLADETVLLIGDHAVNEVVKTHEVQAFLARLEFKGRGGTSHIPIFEKIKEMKLEPDLFIAFTDGDTEFPKKKPPYPVLWCLTTEAKVPWGKSVYIDTRN